MSKNNVKIGVEQCPPGVAIGAFPTPKERYFPGWKLDCIGIGARSSECTSSYVSRMAKRR